MAPPPGITNASRDCVVFGCAADAHRCRHDLGKRQRRTKACQPAARKVPRLMCQASADTPAGSSGQPRLTETAMQTIKDGQDHLSWRPAVVVQNAAASADGNLRMLRVSIDDPMTIIEGRQMERRQAHSRWLDKYEVPGQQVAVKYCSSGAAANGRDGRPDCQARRLFAIASSPYSSRAASADLDATIIELLVQADGERDDAQLAELGPGAMLEVSQTMGRGFASLFNSYTGLLSALEAQRDLLLIAWGCRGMAPLRALVQWTPVQAHATAHAVTLVYIADSQQGAAWVSEWDAWREAGVKVIPVYVGGQLAAAPTGSGDGEGLQEDLEAALFGSQQGLAAFSGVGRRPGELMVFLAGLPSSQLSSLTRRLAIESIAHESILLSDYF